MSRYNSNNSRALSPNQGPVKLSIQNAMLAARVALAANVPLVMWGPPGSGKTAAVKQLAQRLGFDHQVTIGSVIEPSDLLGIPVPNDGPTVEYKASPLVPFGVQDASGNVADFPRPMIWMLDEVDRAELSVQNAYLRLVDERELNGHKLPDNVLIIMAGNGSSDVGTTPLSEAFATRMCHIYIDTNSEKALDGWCQYAAAEGMRPEEIYFARQSRNEFTRENNVEEHAVYNDRSYKEIACELDRMCDTLGNVSHEVRFALLAGSIGRVQALKMVASFELARKAPSIEQIITDPHNVTVPTDVGVVYALSLSLIDYAVKQADREIAEAVMNYGNRFSDEQRNLLYRQLGDKCPAAVVSPMYMNWMRNN